MNPAIEEFEVVIIGAGFSGLCMAIHLRRMGCANLVILEREADYGGTWRSNTYPGCACDVPSLMYSFSFEPNPNWSRSFSSQSEIWAYTRHCFEKYAISGFVRCNQVMHQARYDDASGRWDLATEAGTRYRAAMVVFATGGLSRPSVPHLPGLDTFGGKVFHSATWDHSYDLRDKKVAVIGTGASAIQFVPQIAPVVAQLDLYQRTPPWVVAKDDRPIGRWQRRLFARLPWLQKLARATVYCVLESRAWMFFSQPRFMAAAAFFGRRHLFRQVADPALRAKLLPNYTIGCKRILLSNDYYPALTRPNVHLRTEGIAGIEPTGIRDRQGVLRPVDAILFGTGFETQTPVAPGAIIGAGGVDLGQLWKDGMFAYKGTTVSGFPNAFFLVGPNTGLGHNSILYIIESQVAYVAGAFALLRQRNFAPLTVSAGAQDHYNAVLQARMARSVWKTGCKSWYVAANGKNTTLWPGFTFAFRRQTARFDAEVYAPPPQV
ncbi:MAG: NAD(P)/FAD-dependent oxidoreductase [Myxococcales bacterium]|nr:NAD(P)/FAD-dependent oxidoreductase [Myxococcales bacterium]